MALFGNLFSRQTKGNWYDPLPATPEALPGDSFEQAFKPYATNPDKPSAFGQGGKAWQILGVLGDAMQTWGGGHGTYVPAMLDLQQQTAAEKRQLEMYNRKREDGWTDFRREHQWQLDHPKPTEDAFTRAMAEAGIQPGTPEYIKLAKQRAQMLTQPVQLVPDGMGGMALIRPNAIGSGPQVGDVIDDPRKAGGAAQPGMPPFSGSVGYDDFKRAIIEQESGGRYGVANTEGSGAAGIGQVMPETAKVLAARLGLPFRPDLMGASHPAARQYQDAITDAAVKEAWGVGGAGSDPATSAKYYFGGSNRDRWGPKTNRYAQSILSRLRGS